MSAFEKKSVRWIVHVVFAALGVLAVAWLLRRAGSENVLEAVRRTGPWLPLVLLAEGGRVVSDAWRTLLLFRRRGRAIPFARAFVVQLASYPLALLVPAGGAASEAFKAAMLAEDVGAPLAAAAATVNQALTLFAATIISIPCIVAAWAAWGAHGLTFAVAIQAATAIALGVAIQFATRQRALGHAIARFSKRAGRAVEGYHEEVRALGVVPLAPLGAGMASRGFQLAELTILVLAAGAPRGLHAGLLALGVQLVGGAAGDLVPAQIGATDGSFSIAASSLGIDAAAALAIPLALHVVQLSWAILGALVPMKRPNGPAEPANERDHAIDHAPPQWQDSPADGR